MNMSHAYSIPMPVSSPATRRSEASSTGISGTTPAANPHAAQLLTAALRRGATTELAAGATSPVSLPEAQVSASHLAPLATLQALHPAQAEAQRQAAEPIRMLQVDDHVVMGNGIRF